MSAGPIAASVLCVISAALTPLQIRAQDDVVTIGGARMRPLFHVVVQRSPARGDLVEGTISVNGTDIGGTVENAQLMIAAGSYKGVLRYKSDASHAQGPFGMLAHTGDFLLEVSGVDGRKNILFHGGDKPRHSLGCILLGAVTRSTDGTRAGVIPDEAPLRKLRLMFYGTDFPNATPDVDIVIDVNDSA